MDKKRHHYNSESHPRNKGREKGTKKSTYSSTHSQYGQHPVQQEKAWYLKSNKSLCAGKKKKVSLRCVKKKPSKRSCDSVEVVIWMEVGGKYSTREAKKRRFIRANWRYTPANIKLWTLQRPPITTTQLGYRPIWLLSEIDNSWKIGHSAIGVFMLWP